MKITRRGLLLGATVLLLLANVGVKVGTAAMEPERTGRCTLTPNPIPGQPDSCGCSWLSEPTNCDALVGPNMVKCKLSAGECVPDVEN